MTKRSRPPGLPSTAENRARVEQALADPTGDPVLATLAQAIILATAMAHCYGNPDAAYEALLGVMPTRVIEPLIDMVNCGAALGVLVAEREGEIHRG